MRCDGVRYAAILFNHAEPLPESIRAVYRLQVNEFRDMQNLELQIEHWEPA
jgi:single-stranded-DNA-specific exonuclease